MSYEGHVELLCEIGHYTAVDAYDEMVYDADVFPVNGKCRCGLEFVWIHSVDDTNCDGENYPLQILSAPVYETCPHCKQVELKKDPRYIIPDEGRFK